MTKLAQIAVWWLAGVSISWGQAHLPEPRLHALILQGIDLTWQERYKVADSVFLELTREFPDHPAGYIYRAGLLQSVAMDNEDVVDRARFDSLIELGKLKAKELVRNDQLRQWGHFFLGTADGSDSYARVYRGDWFGGTRRALASVSSFKDALGIDSTLYDAYAAIGAFNYWRSRKTESFNWLPFLGDDRPESFVLLQKSIDGGIYNRSTALSLLSAICLDAGRYDQAIRCCEEALRRYPSNRTFLWGKATALHRLERWRDGELAYRNLLAAILAADEPNHYNEVVCRLNLARIQVGLGDTASARTQLKAILKNREADFPEHLKARAAEKLAQARELERSVVPSATPAE